MVFHALWVIYTVKELDSHDKHGQSKKNKKTFGRITVFLCQIHSFRVRISFRKFSSMALHDVMKRGIPCMGISPGRASARTRQPEREQEYTHQHHWQHCTGLAREECLQRSVFGCEGKITLFSFPKKSNGVSQVCLFVSVILMKNVL